MNRQSGTPESAATQLTVGEAASKLGFSPSTVQKLADDGVLQSVRTPGGHRRIEIGSLRSYMRQSGFGDLDNESGTSARAARTAPRVLLVDDDAMARTILQHIFASRFPQCSVSTAVDGLDAVVQLMQAPPDLVVTDLGMPHDGFRLVRLLRTRPEFAATRVAVVSGMSESDIELGNGLPEGVTLFAKPIEIERFLGFVEGALQVPAVRKAAK